MHHAQRIAYVLIASAAAFLLLAPAIAFASDGSDSGLVPFEVAQFGTTGLVGLYTWFATSQRVTQKKHDEGIETLGKRIAKTRQELEARITAVEHRIAVAEELAKHVPTAAQITDLIVAIGDLRGDVRAQSVEIASLRGDVGSLSRRFDTYETHMLEASK